MMIFWRKLVCTDVKCVNKCTIPDSHQCFPNMKNAIFCRIKISDLLTRYVSLWWLPLSAVAQFCQGVNLEELFTDIWVGLSQQVVISYLWSGAARLSNFHWKEVVRAFWVELVQHEISLFARNGRVFHLKSPEFFIRSAHCRERVKKNIVSKKTEQNYHLHFNCISYDFSKTCFSPSAICKKTRSSGFIIRQDQQQKADGEVSVSEMGVWTKGGGGLVRTRGL